MIKYSCKIERYERNGEKTGWSYIVIRSAQAQKLKPATKVSFRVKGKIDQHVLNKVAIIPIGKGAFILPVNGPIRKAIGKKEGDKVTVTLELDERQLTLSHDLMACLGEDAVALAYFNSLPRSHQLYFSKWIESAKTASTKTKRIVMAVIALGQRQGYSEMMRANKTQLR